MSDYYSPASASDGNRNSRQGSDICPDLGHDTDYFLEHAQNLHHQTFLHQNPIKKNEMRRALPFNFPMDSPNETAKVCCPGRVSSAFCRLHLARKKDLTPTSAIVELLRSIRAREFTHLEVLRNAAAGSFALVAS
jgi:hypothetical protein